MLWARYLHYQHGLCNDVIDSVSNNLQSWRLILHHAWFCPKLQRQNIWDRRNYGHFVFASLYQGCHIRCVLWGKANYKVAPEMPAWCDIFILAIPHNPILINSLWGLVPSLPRLAAASPGVGCVAFVGQRSWWGKYLGLPGHTVKGHHQSTFLVAHPADQSVGYWRLNGCTWFSLMSVQKMI